MRLLLLRAPSSAACTLGTLFVDDTLFCFTLEDVHRAVKVPGETCVPAGTYPVTITESARFRRRLPLVGHVPGFEGIRLHPGNTAADTAGCILVGLARGTDRVTRSREAFDRLFPLLDAALSRGESLTLTIEDASPTAALEHGAAGPAHP